jgi:beta-glucosidase
MDLGTILERLPLNEQVALLAGASFWSTVPLPTRGVPAIKVTDGPNGARGGGGLVGGVSAACFPAGIALAASWDPELVREIGQALADEAKSKGARVLLAPTVNLQRHPLGGRNFECFSEDPYLTAEMAAAYIEGLQSQRVAATIKHFVGNESEFERMTMSSEIDERPLRELYLYPFEVAVKRAKVWAVMAAYNRLNGSYASEHPRLLTDILRREWGFEGLVMSDWFGMHSTAQAINAGLDLEMPGPTRHRGEKLVAAVERGEVAPETVRESARRVLKLIERVGAFDNSEIPDEQAVDRPEHRALIRRAGAEGMVLLKNTGLLPLDAARLKRVAVIGPNAKVAQIMGGGSAQVNAHYRVSPFEGLSAQLKGAEISFAPGCSNYRLLPLLEGPVTVDYYASSDLSGKVVASGELASFEVMWLGEVAPGVDPTNFSARLTARFTPQDDGEYHLGLVSAGRSRLLLDGELLIENWESWQAGGNYFGQANDERVGIAALKAGQSYTITAEYSSQAPGGLGLKALRVGADKPLGEVALEHAAQTAAGAAVALLFVGLSGEWDSEGQDRPTLALPGRQDALIERVAAANPNTVVVLQSGGPVAMPWLDKVAAVVQAWYPGQECGNAIADVLLGRTEPGGRLPQSFPKRLKDAPAYLHYPGENGRVRYGEGLFIGYRYYDARDIEPLFPFGFGLSYTSFTYSNLRLSSTELAPDEALTVALEVTNTGARPGSEVVQLYVRDLESRLLRPEKELKGFAKVRLAPGETKTVTLRLDMRALSYFDDAHSLWIAEPGDFEVLVGASSRDIRLRERLVLTGEWVSVP